MLSLSHKFYNHWGCIFYFDYVLLLLWYSLESAFLLGQIQTRRQHRARLSDNFVVTIPFPLHIFQEAPFTEGQQSSCYERLGLREFFDLIVAVDTSSNKRGEKWFGCNGEVGTNICITTAMWLTRNVIRYGN